MAEPVPGRSSPRAMLPVAFLTVGVLLIGCSDGGEGEAQADPVASSSSASTSSSTSPSTSSSTSSGGQDTPSTVATASADSGVDGTINASGGVVDLGGAEVRHESGVVVTFERLVVEPSYVVLAFSAANGSPDEVALAGDTARGITLELDDPAVLMTYRAPSVNETLELSSGEVLEAEIVFLGVLPADASVMDITFNPQPEPDGDVVEPTIRADGIPIRMTGG